MADLTIKYTEEMIGGGHPTKTDTLNRLALGRHNSSGTHKDIVGTKEPFIDVTGYLPEGYVKDGSIDYVTQIQSAFDAIPATGGIRVVWLPCFTLGITTNININKNNLVIRGYGDISLIKTMNGAANFTAMFNLATGLKNVTIRDLTLDGNSDNNTTNTTAGIYALNSDHLTIKDCTVKNTPQNGIYLAATTLAHTNFRITDNTCLNIGWRAIQVHMGDTGHISDNDVISSGNHGIAITYGDIADVANTGSKHVTLTDNYVNRAVPPTTILTGQVESGMMINVGTGGFDIIVDTNRLYDNRTAGNDGLASGAPNGTDPFFYGIVFSNNVITLAGGFGIDPTSNCIVTGNIVDRAATHGIAIAGDLGPDRQNILIEGNMIRNCNFANTAGSAIAGIRFNSAVDNSKTWKRIRIINNTVIDSAGFCAYGLHINAAKMDVQNVDVFGNDFALVATQSIFLATGGGHTITDLRVRDNKMKTTIGLFTNADATPSIQGRSLWSTNNSGATTITMLDDGVAGEEVTIRFGDGNTTIDFSGTNLKGNGGVDYAAAIGSSMHCVYTGTQWMCFISKA